MQLFAELLKFTLGVSQQLADPRAHTVLEYVLELLLLLLKGNKLGFDFKVRRWGGVRLIVLITALSSFELLQLLLQGLLLQLEFA